MAMKLKQGVTYDPTTKTATVDTGVYKGVVPESKGGYTVQTTPQQPSHPSSYGDFVARNGSENDPNYTGGNTGQPTGAGSVSDILGSMGGEDQFTTDYYANLANTANSAIDEDAIRKQKESEYQAQIDSVNRLYADKLNQSRIQGQGRLGSSTAMQARGGLLGSDFGAAQTSNVQAYNTDINNSIENERQSAINDIFAEIRTNATAEIAAKRAAKEAGAKEYLTYLAGATERKATKHSNAAKILLSKGVDPKSVSDEELKKLGLTRDELTMAYSELKAGADSAALASERETAEYDRGVSEFEMNQKKTEAEIAKINYEASKNYEEGGIIYNAQGQKIGVKQGENYEAGGKIYEASTNKYLGDAVKPGGTTSNTEGLKGPMPDLINAQDGELIPTTNPAYKNINNGGMQCGEYVNRIAGTSFGDTLAQKKQVAPSTTGTVGDAVVIDVGNNVGHVGIIVGEQGNNWVVKSSNYKLDGRVSTDLVPKQKAVGYRQIGASGPKQLDSNTRVILNQEKSSFRSNPVIKAFEEGLQQYTDIVVSLDDESGPGDTAGIFQFMKSLDPNSVVRETEFDAAARSAGVAAYVGNTWDRLTKGKKLTPDQAMAFKKLTKAYINNRAVQYNRLYDDMTRTLINNNIDESYFPTRATDQLNGGQNQSSAPAPEQIGTNENGTPMYAPTGGQTGGNSWTDPSTGVSYNL